MIPHGDPIRFGFQSNYRYFVTIKTEILFVRLQTNVHLLQIDAAQDRL